MLISLISIAFADIPSGSTISQAAYLDIPPDGFASFATIIPELVPQNTSVEPTADGGEGLGCEYAYNLDNMWIAIEVNNTTITPQNGHLSLDIDLMVNVNDLVDRFAIDFSVTSCGFFDSESACYGYVTPFPATVQAKIDLVLVDPDGDGIKELDATIYDLNIDYEVDANNFEIECLVGSILDALSWIGVDVYSFVLDLIRPTLEDELYEQLPQLEETIEEAFANAVINEDVAIGDSTMKVVLSPEELSVVPEGLRFSFDGMTQIQADASCIAEYDSGSSLETEGTPNDIGIMEIPADLGISIRDEFVNQALYSVWKGGSLCQTIDEETFALDTSILNLLTGDAFVPLFPETKPMLLKLDPKTPPTMNTSSTSDLGMDIEDLQLQFITEMDYRQTQILTLSLDMQAGLDLNFDPNIGTIEGALTIDPEQMTSSIVANEFRPDDAQTITQGFSDQFGSVLDLVGLDALLDSLNFTLPSINGIGVNQIEIAGTGSNQSDLGIYASIGPVPYIGGCSDEDETSAGCATTQIPKGKRFLMAIVLVLGCLRRRAT